MNNEPQFIINGETVPVQEVKRDEEGQPRFPAFEITHELLRDLAEGHDRVFESGKLLGLYLGGSLATGDFDDNTSDLDFFAVLQSAATNEEIGQLRELHHRIRSANKNRLYGNYEGEYLTREQALNPKAADMRTLHLGSDGHLDLENSGAGLTIELWKVRTSGFTVIGPPPEELIAGISADEMVEANTQLFESSWMSKLERHEPMDGEYQAYAALTMARVLYTLMNGSIASKGRAAAWCSESFPQYASLISEARAWRPGTEYDRQDEVYGLIEFVSQRIEGAEPARNR